MPCEESEQTHGAMAIETPRHQRLGVPMNAKPVCVGRVLEHVL